MIELTRLNGEMIMVNPDHLRFVGSCPDTLLTFTDGKTLLVKETPEQVNKKLIQCRQMYYATPERAAFIQEDPCK